MVKVNGFVITEDDVLNSLEGSLIDSFEDMLKFANFLQKMEEKYNE